MPAENTDYQEVSNFSTGPWHAFGAEVGPAKGFTYSCVNMQVYENGSLGPRPCFVEVNSSDDSIDLTHTNILGTAFLHMNYDYELQNTVATSNNKVLYIFTSDDANQLRLNLDNKDVEASIALTDSNAITRQSLPARYAAVPENLIGTLSHEELGNEIAIVGGEAQYTNFASGSVTTDTLTAGDEYPASWDPHTCFTWRDRYWSWGDASNANRIHYSAVGNNQSWGANDYIDLGADANRPIVGVWSIYDSMLIAMKDLRWYKFMFTDSPDFGEIRYIGTKRIPDFAVQPASPGDSLVYLTRDSGVVVATKDEIDDISLSHVKVPSDGEDEQLVYFLRGISCQGKNSVILPYHVDTVVGSGKETFKGDRSIDMVNGVWVNSLYWGPTSGSDLNPAIIDTFRAGNSHIGCVTIEDTNSGDDGEKVYIRPVTLNRPSNSNDAWSSNTEIPGHASADTTDRFEGRVWLGTYRPPEYSLGRIEKVIIEFDYWNAGGFTTPAFVVKADYVHDGDTKSTLTLGTLDATALTSTSNYIANKSRVVFTPAAMPMASSVDIFLEGIKSVAFYKICVEYAVQAQTPLTGVNL